MGSFALDVGRFCDRTGANLQLAVRYITLEAFSRIIQKTPVDTGCAKGNWGCSYGAPGTAYNLNYRDKTGTVVLTKVSETVWAWDCKGSIFLSNSLPYIGILEYGRENGTPGSRQAPNGMVRITLEEMQGWINSIQGRLT